VGASGPSRRDLDGPQKSVDEPGLGSSFVSRLGAQADAVSEDGDGQRLHVVGAREVSTLKDRSRLRGAKERQRPARAHSEVEVARLAGPRHEAQNVPGNVFL
jgi:hypothetical protein